MPFINTYPILRTISDSDSAMHTIGIQCWQYTQRTIFLPKCTPSHQSLHNKNPLLSQVITYVIAVLFALEVTHRELIPIRMSESNDKLCF